MEERVQACVGWGPGRCGNVADGVFRLRRVGYGLEPGNQGVSAMGRDRQKLREQRLVK